MKTALNNTLNSIFTQVQQQLITVLYRYRKQVHTSKRKRQATHISKQGAHNAVLDFTITHTYTNYTYINISFKTVLISKRIY